MTAKVECPRWCDGDDSCDAGEHRGMHRGPTGETVHLDSGGGYVELEVVQGNDDDGPMVLVEEWTSPSHHYPAVSWKIPAPAARAFIVQLGELLAELDRRADMSANRGVDYDGGHIELELTETALVLRQRAFRWDLPIDLAAAVVVNAFDLLEERGAIAQYVTGNPPASRT